MSKPYRICILGGGIIGLTTCCYFLKSYSSSSITITLISAEFSPNITSAVAGGYWHSPEREDLSELARHSYDIFLAESFSMKAQHAGVMSMTSYVLHGSNEQYSTADYIPNDKPRFSSYVKHFHQLTNEELNMFDQLKPLSGYSFTTVVVETKKYLHYLMLYLKQHSNVEFRQTYVKNFDELSSDNFDLIINCTGLGARKLVTDETNLYSERGQTIRVYAPHIKSVYLFDDGLGYIIPQTDHIVLGGTKEKDNESKEINPVQKREILEKSRRIFPSLIEAEIKAESVGFRPSRRIDNVLTIRLECDEKRKRIIHNYGHGGNGITLSWGCARRVIQLAQTLIPSRDSADQLEKKDMAEHEKLWRIIEKN